MWGFFVLISLLVFAQAAFCEDYENAIRDFEKALQLSPDNEAIKKNLAVAYNNYAIALFEKDRYDLAYLNFKQALNFDPLNKTIKDNMYNITLQEAQASFEKGRLQEALTLAKNCIDYDAKNTNAYVFLGNIYYKENNLKEALFYWDEALNIDSTIVGLRESYEKAKRELEIEQGFKTRSRTYFSISFEGETDSELVWDIIDILEEARYKTKSDFGFFTDKEIQVIIYNTEQFKQATQKLDWTFGLYDGKIRLRVGDIRPLQEMTERVICHEYGHAILHTLYPNNIPAWLHEGFAQAAEPTKDVSQQEIILLKAFIKNEGFSLDRINKLFESDDYKQVNTAYISSKLFFKYLIDKYGMSKFKNLLEKLNRQTGPEESIYDIYRAHMADIEKDFISSLR